MANTGLTIEQEAKVEEETKKRRKSNEDQERVSSVDRIAKVGRKNVFTGYN